MSTFYQLFKKPRKKPSKKNRVRALQESPLKKGVCLRIFRLKPKKPNSAQRKVAKVKLSTGFTIFAYIEGEGHNLQKHSIVLVRGGRVRDLPGVKYHTVRGKYDLAVIANRNKKRSRYGIKKKN